MIRLFLSFLLLFSASGTRAETDWTERLEALTPSRPGGYFDLAEEVADAAENDEDRALARQLFRLGGVLDPDRLGRSACLALADLESDPDEKRRLLALAGLLDRRTGEPNWITTPGEAMIDASAALALGDAFSHYRNGQGHRAEAALDASPGARQLLIANASVIGGEKRFLENTRRYRAGVSPVKTDRERVDLLRLEAALLAGEDRSWSGELLLHRGRTLVEVEYSRLAEALGVDPSRTIYREGRWIAPVLDE